MLNNFNGFFNFLCIDVFLCYLQGYWASTLPPAVCQWFQYRMDTIINNIINTWISFDNLYRGKDIWPKTWKWNIAIDIHKHSIILACLFWKNSCGGISRRKLHWTCYNHLVIYSTSSWYCICPGKQKCTSCYYENLFYSCALTSILTKGFRKRRGRYHLTMLRDTVVGVGGFKSLHTFLSRSVMFSLDLRFLFVGWYMNLIYHPNQIPWSEWKPEPFSWEHGGFLSWIHLSLPLQPEHKVSNSICTLRWSW